MVKFVFIILIISLVGFNSFAGVPSLKIYQGKEYPVSGGLFKKLDALSQNADKLQNDITNLSLSPEANYQINEIEYILDVVNALLNLEAIHSDSSQFSLRAVQNIKDQVSNYQFILKKIPDQCLVDMQEPGVFPEEHAYLGKIKDISIETDQLLDEIVRELSEFK